MKALYTTATIIFTFCNSIHAQWQKLPINSEDNFHSLQFVSEDVGFASACDNPSAWNSITLFKTTDGGFSWNPVLQSTGGDCIYQTYFIDGSIGYSGTPNGIMKTTNGGTTWFNTHSAENAGIKGNYISFTNKDIGFTSGGEIYKTVDGGQNWQPVYTSKNWVSSLFFTSAQVGYAIVSDTSYILKTDDAGQQWKRIDTKFPILSVHFSSPGIGYGVGFKGVVVKTTDAGNSWFQLAAGNLGSLTLRSVFCTDNNTCYAVGDSGTIVKTSDGGDSWQKEPSGTQKNLNVIYCTKNGTCFIAGDSGILLKKEITLGIPEPKGEKKSNLMVYPNPFGQQTTIQYTVTGEEQGAYILLSDIQGKEFKRISVPGIQGEYTVILENRDFHPGMYLCTLYSNGKASGTIKFIVKN